MKKIVVAYSSKPVRHTLLGTLIPDAAEGNFPPNSFTVPPAAGSAAMAAAMAVATSAFPFAVPALKPSFVSTPLMLTY